MSDAVPPAAPVLLRRSAFHQRRQRREDGLDRAIHGLHGLCLRRVRRSLRPLRALVRRATDLEDRLRGLEETAFAVEQAALRDRLLRGQRLTLPSALDLAVLRESARRSLGLRAHDTQVLGAAVVMSGRLAEMATGEGKTLVAGLAAAWRALAGSHVHVVTVNDYLAARDSEFLRPFFASLGLTVSVVTSETPRENRAAAYRCMVCYCTNKELAFDYLRQVAASPPSGNPLYQRVRGFLNDQPSASMLPGLEFAIVDEADSVLIDEARTPLVLSQPGEDQITIRTIRLLSEFADTLQQGQDFVADPVQFSVEVAPAVNERLRRFLATETRGILSIPGLQEELLHQLLLARHVVRRDEHYLVNEGKVEMVDEYTGRIMPDRKWRTGLHQMIEYKEGCAITQPLETIASMTYQRFFRRYVALSGMSGTVREVARELWNVYGLDTVPLPTHRPVQRKVLPDRVFRSQGEKWSAVLARVSDLHGKGIPVLVGCRTVEASHHLGNLLAGAGLDHQVLNATEARREAEIIARAGQRGAITVATNMAGRGTDIVLGPDVPGLGGLHVLMTERHDSRRIDRQLEGRCGRQGDPGCFQALVSLEDRVTGSLASSHVFRPVMMLARRFPSLLGRRVLRLAQSRIESRHSAIRQELLVSDRTQQDILAFSGLPE